MKTGSRPETDLYLDIKDKEKTTEKFDNFFDFLAKMDELKQVEEKNEMFIINLENDLIHYDRAIVEMKNIQRAQEVKKLIAGRLVILNEYTGERFRDRCNKAIRKAELLNMKLDAKLFSLSDNPTSEPVNTHQTTNSEHLSEAKRDLSKLDELIREKYKDKQRKDDKSKLDRLKIDIETFVSAYDKSDITALAQLIYESNWLHKNVKPPYFKDWLVIFCNIINTKTPTLKQSQVTERYDKMKIRHYYLID